MQVSVGEATMNKSMSIFIGPLNMDVLVLAKQQEFIFLVWADKGCCLK